MKPMRTEELIQHTLEDVRKTANSTGLKLTDGVTAKVIADVLERAKEISFTPKMLDNVITEGFRLAIVLKGDTTQKRKYTKRIITTEVRQKRKYTKGTKPIGRPRKVVLTEVAI